MGSGQQWSASYTRLGTNYTVTAQPQTGGYKALILVPTTISDGRQSWGYVYPNGSNSGGTNYLFHNGTSNNSVSAASIAKCGRSLRSTYTWNGLQVMQTMTVTTDGEIVHEWTLTNNSNGTFTGTVAPSIDTDLNGTDSVPLYADGVGGVYMSGSGYTLAMDPVNGVGTMYAGRYSSNKGSDWHKVAGVATDQTVVSGVDTATFYETPNLNLAKGESYTFSFKENTYKAGEYRVLLDGNGGTFNGDPTNSLWVKSGDKATFDHTPTYTKHELKGWSTSKDGSTGLFDVNTPITDNTTLYAQWELVKHEVTFDANGGTLTSDGSVNVTDGDKVSEPSDPTRTGYDFTGWTISATGGESYDFDDAVTSPVTLHAQWDPHEYEIAFDANTGEGSMPQQQMTYDKAANLSANKFTKPGYTFTGWNTGRNGDETSYAPEQNVKNLTSEDGKTITLYAQWKADPQTITYDANGETEGATPTTNGVTDQKVPIAANGFIRDGYRFDSWNTQADGKGIAYKPGDDVTLPAGGITLYAQWRGMTSTLPRTGGDMNMLIPVGGGLALAVLGGAGYMFSRRRRMNRV